jgi:hypothetical protein
MEHANRFNPSASFNQPAGLPAKAAPVVTSGPVCSTCRYWKFCQAAQVPALPDKLFGFCRFEYPANERGWPMVGEHDTCSRHEAGANVTAQA